MFQREVIIKITKEISQISCNGINYSRCTKKIAFRRWTSAKATSEWRHHSHSLHENFLISPHLPMNSLDFRCPACVRVPEMAISCNQIYLLPFFNPCGESDQLIVHLNFAKNCWAKRSKKREAKLRVKNENLKYFDAKLRFALFASLRSAIFSEIQVDN